MSEFPDLLAGKKEVIVPSVKDNLHWSGHSTNGNAIVTPGDIGTNFQATKRLTHAAWVCDYAMEIEPVMRKSRLDGAFRHLPEAAVISPGEFFVPRGA